MLVIKVSGKLVHDEVTLDAIAKLAMSRDVLVLHGAGPQLDAAWVEKGWPIERIGGLRVTPPEAAQLVHDVLLETGKTITGALNRRGAGIKQQVLGSDKVSATPHANSALQRVGVNPFIRLDSILPGVLTILAGDPAPINVNADDLVAPICKVINVEEVLLATDVAGVLVNGIPLESVRLGDRDRLVLEEIVTGGMIVKIDAALALSSQIGAPVRIGPVGAPGTLVIGEILA